jgi:hypothetical protein
MPLPRRLLQLASRREALNRVEELIDLAKGREAAIAPGNAAAFEDVIGATR